VFSSLFRRKDIAIAMSRLMECGVEALKWFFPQERATLHAFRYGNSVKMMMGMNQNMFVSPFRRHCTLSALRSLRLDRATMRLRLRDNNRGHYTNPHVVLHADSRPDGRREINL
jgi:hypothetical protein